MQKINKGIIQAVFFIGCITHSGVVWSMMTLENQMVTDNSALQWAQVKEIYIIPMMIDSTQPRQVARDTMEKVQKAPQKEKVTQAIEALRKEADKEDDWSYLFSLRTAGFTERLKNLVPFSKDLRVWQILHISLRTPAKSDKELEGFAYKAMSKLTYNALSTSNTIFYKYENEFKAVVPRAAIIQTMLPRIIKANKAYFFIPIEEITAEKVTKNAHKAWRGSWSQYAFGGINQQGAFVVTVGNRGVTIDDIDKNFIQDNYKQVVAYTNSKIDTLRQGWQTRKKEKLVALTEYRWDDFSGTSAVFSDVNSPNSILDPVSAVQLSINGKSYPSVMAYYNVTSQDCDDMECNIKNMFKGNYYKFKNNSRLRTVLTNTGDQILMYSIDDETLGIGLSKKGQNQVGRMLMFFRDNINRVDTDSVDQLWNLYTPGPGDWGKGYAQKTYESRLRYAVNRLHMYEGVLRYLGYRR